MVYHYGELYHHGILGMKWGVRRYQNEDGSLTEEGKRRYYEYTDKSGKKQYLKRSKKQLEYYDKEQAYLNSPVGRAATSFSKSDAFKELNHKYWQELDFYNTAYGYDTNKLIKDVKKQVDNNKEFSLLTSKEKEELVNDIVERIAW